MKPKENKESDLAKSSGYDQCQTPDYAVEPLLPYLGRFQMIWEPAEGEGNITRFLTKSKRMTLGTDILTGTNFFTYSLSDYDIIVTNPPYSIKYEWIQHCYELDKPFALLMPLETLAAWKAQKYFREHGISLLVPNKRINFKRPNAGWNGGGAQFPTAWFCWRLPINDTITYVDIVPRPQEQLKLFA